MTITYQNAFLSKTTLFDKELPMILICEECGQQNDVIAI